MNMCIWLISWIFLIFTQLIQSDYHVISQCKYKLEKILRISSFIYLSLQLLLYTCIEQLEGINHSTFHLKKISNDLFMLWWIGYSLLENSFHVNVLYILFINGNEFINMQDRLIFLCIRLSSFRFNSLIILS